MFKLFEILHNYCKAPIGHFTVVCLVTWPMTEIETGVDLSLIQTSLIFLCKCKLVSIRTTWFTQKNREIYIKTRSPPASLLFKGQVTEQPNGKWSILFNSTLTLTVLKCSGSKNKVVRRWHEWKGELGNYINNIHLPFVVFDRCSLHGTRPT